MAGPADLLNSGAPVQVLEPGSGRSGGVARGRRCGASRRAAQPESGRGDSRGAFRPCDPRRSDDHRRIGASGICHRSASVVAAASSRGASRGERTRGERFSRVAERAPARKATAAAGPTTIQGIGDGPGFERVSGTRPRPRRHGPTRCWGPPSAAANLDSTDPGSGMWDPGPQGSTAATSRNGAVARCHTVTQPINRAP